MAINFETKPGFIFGANTLNKNQNFFEKTAEKSSSGKRINSAADDAAGLAVLSKLEAALSGTEQAIRNALFLSAIATFACTVPSLLSRGRYFAE